MESYEWKDLPAEKDTLAPDGSEVRVLLAIAGRGSMAHFRLEPGQTSLLVTHRTVDEIWYIVAGRGRLFRSEYGKAGQEDELLPGRCVTIPVGTHFQFRADPETRLEIVGVTMPPWPLDREEAVRTVDHWPPNVPA